MGFATVGAAAIVLGAIAISGYQIAGSIFDAQHALESARLAALRLDAAAVHAAVQVTSVDAAGGAVDIDVENSGSATLDASAVDVLLDGSPATVASRTVDGASTAVWPPATTLHLHLVADPPSSVAVATAAGAAGYWRA